MESCQVGIICSSVKMAFACWPPTTWTSLMPGKAEDMQMNVYILNSVVSSVDGCRFVQFFLRLGCGKAAPDPRSQPVLLQFSVDGGLTWGLLQEFLFSNSSNQARLVALEIPLRARTTSTRIRWWQPSESGHFYSPWVIDQVSGCFHLGLIVQSFEGFFQNYLFYCICLFVGSSRWECQWLGASGR